MSERYEYLNMNFMPSFLKKGVCNVLHWHAFVRSEKLFSSNMYG